MNTQYFDPSTGLLDRRVFSDDEIYQTELTHIFGRAWHFMCHESQIPDIGDYFMSWIGEDEVIAVRGRDARIYVHLNTCPHRGNTVCRAELGNTKSFFCSYHGWNFGLNGRLISVPGEDVFYRSGLDKPLWGLTSAAQVDTYHGFVFATLDHDAPPLSDYLGWVGRLGIDLVASQGTVKFLDGVVKNRVQCNWKIAVDNLYDWYHVKVSHGSALKIGMMQEEPLSLNEQMVLLGQYGHGIGGPGLSEADYQASAGRIRAGKGENRHPDITLKWRLNPESEALLGPIGKRCFGHPNIFPNLWVATTSQLCLRIPRGPLATELWWFSYEIEEMDVKERRNNLFAINHFFGPGGILEQDDGENWSHSTRGAKGTRSQTLPVNLSMGINTEAVGNDAPGQTRFETVVSEHAQRWMYQSWQDWLAAESWQALMANHSTPPLGPV